MCGQQRLPQILKELAKIMSYDTGRQDMLFNAYRGFYCSLLLMVSLASIVFPGMLIQMASNYRDSYFGYLYAAFSNASLFGLLSLVCWPLKRFSRRHYVVITIARVILEDAFFIFVHAHCRSMRRYNDPHPISLSLMDQSKQESFWCDSRNNAFLYLALSLFGLIPGFMGTLTFLECTISIVSTTLSLVIIAFFQENDLWFPYLVFALFVLVVFSLLKVILVGKEYALHMGLRINDKASESHSRERVGDAFFENLEYTKQNPAFHNDVKVNLHESQQHGAESRLRITDFLSQTSNDLSSCIALIFTSVDFLWACQPSDAERHWWMLEAQRTLMQRMTTIIKSQQDLIGIMRKQTISKPSVEPVRVEGLLQYCAGLTQNYFFPHAVKVKYVIDQRVADQPILSCPSWLQHMLMVCLSYARTTISVENGRIEVRVLLQDSLCKRNFEEGKPVNDSHADPANDQTAVDISETKTDSYSHTHKWPPQETWDNYPMIRFEVRSLSRERSNCNEDSKAGAFKDSHFKSFQSDLDSSRLGLFILEFKAVLLQGSCGIDDIPSSERSTGGNVIWFEVPYVKAKSKNIDPNMDLDDPIMTTNSHASASFTTPLPQKELESDSGAITDHIDSVLVVDGDHTAVMILCTVIQSLGIKRIDVALNSEQGEHYMKVRPYSVVFFNPLILRNANSSICVQRYRAWEKIHRSSRQFICGVSAVAGAKAFCKNVGMDECVSKVSSGPHVKRLVRSFLESEKNKRHLDSSIQRDKPYTEKPTLVESKAREDTGINIEMIQLESANLNASEPEVDIQAFCAQMQNKTGDLTRFVNLFLKSGQRTLDKIKTAVRAEHGDDIGQKFADLRNEAHTMKGAALMMYAKPLSRLCSKLEEYCKETKKKAAENTNVYGSTASLDPVKSMVEAIEKRWDLAVLQLNNMKTD